MTVEIQPRTVAMLAAVALAFAAGRWSGSSTAVHAADDTPQFQMRPMGSNDQLAVYYPGDKTLYLYPAIMSGNAGLQCSYKLHMGDPGGVIRREQCPIPSLIP